MSLTIHSFLSITDPLGSKKLVQHATDIGGNTLDRLDPQSWCFRPGCPTLYLIFIWPLSVLFPGSVHRTCDDHHHNHPCNHCSYGRCHSLDPFGTIGALWIVSVMVLTVPYLQPSTPPFVIKKSTKKTAPWVNENNLTLKQSWRILERKVLNKSWCLLSCMAWQPCKIKCLLLTL